MGLKTDVDDGNVFKCLVALLVGTIRIVLRVYLVL